MGLETVRISELTEQQNIDNNDLIEISTSNIQSKKTPISNFFNWVGNSLSFSPLKTTSKTVVGAINELAQREDTEPSGAGFHNSIYRGKHLGQYPSVEQIENIDNGSFKDLYIGDYWCSDITSSSAIKWRIAAFDYYYGVGPQPTTTHHVIIVPDGLNMNGDVYNNSNRGGYKYAYYRGFFDSYWQITTTEENQTILDPQYTGYHLHWCSGVVTEDPTLSNGLVYWELAEEPDPTIESVGVKIKGGYNYKTAPGSTFNHYGIPAGTTVYWAGSYQNNTPYYYNQMGPGIARIIKSQFLNGEIMNFPLLCTCERFNDPFTIVTDWIDGSVELMTEQQVNGARTIGVNYNFESDIVFDGTDFHYNRKRFETTIDSVQFPLFKLGYKGNYENAQFASEWFWLRDRTYEKQPSLIGTYYTFLRGEQNAVCGLQNYCGGQWGTPQKQYSYGIRPYFCLAKYASPTT